MIYDKENKTITTERLVLRIFEKSDAETVTKLCNNYNIYKNTLYIPYPYSIDCALLWIQAHVDNFDADRLYEFAITDKEKGILYGAVALSNNQRFNNGEIAYWIGEEFWGNGYATEASKAILEFAFNVKGYHKVYARYFASNPASGRVIEKLGMVREGILIDHVMKDSRYEDLIYYGIINS
ncbi:GNAT family N-acetyltransferase [Tissierella pigra]|uniref:GNAT family N-acetyltransferase n=1 Tax=Tissierella pigra TaxID=2607614 RepID=A0A6N7XHF3_9FIRM|nr:GNAT family N-acetyltransferase [Tissierella pigra]MBU5424942.1 GNAT family N-acetyltransferase [Tissierella pigra]MSU01116.1 GNAT family N-acetyltransferase [Tissierella pigra]